MKDGQQTKLEIKEKLSISFLTLLFWVYVQVFAPDGRLPEEHWRISQWAHSLEVHRELSNDQGEPNRGNLDSQQQ